MAAMQAKQTAMFSCFIILTPDLIYNYSFIVCLYISITTVYLYKSTKLFLAGKFELI